MDAGAGHLAERRTSVNRAIAIAVAGFAIAVTAASAQSVEGREQHLQRRIAESIERHRVSPHDASRLERDMDKVSRHIDKERRKHYGRLSPNQWEKLNRELDKVEQRLEEAQRRARYDDRRERNRQRDGFYQRDHDRDWRWEH
jgi:Skp family chaperone for outer membrane proteins